MWTRELLQKKKIHIVNRLNAFDIELYIDEKNYYRPYCICYNIDKEYYYDYLDKINEENDLIEYVIFKIFNIIKDKKIKKIIFYAHNLNFDGALVIDSLTKKKKYIFSSFMRDMSVYNIKIIFENFEIILNCSYKIFPIALSKIADDFTSLKKLPFPYMFAKFETLQYIGNVPKVEFWNSPQDYNNYIENNKNNIFNFKEYSIKYCINDVKITHLFMEKIVEMLYIFKIDISEIYSGPSLALKIFIKIFNKKKISFSVSKIYDKIIRHSYCGGKCEVYGNPENGDYIFHFDFSGMYAQCMKEKFAFGAYEVKTMGIGLDKPGFYLIDFNSNLEFPILPIHDKITNKLIFPNGNNLLGCFWFEEILLFIEKGGIVNKIIYGIEFKNFDFAFNEYVDFFTKIREKGGAYKLFGKNMNNFFYGRLGMSDPDEHTFFVNENEFNYYKNWSKLEIINIEKINEMFMISIRTDQYSRKKLKLRDIKFKKNIGIASAITSKSRIKLFKAQESVRMNNGRVLYSDTDSIFASYKYNVLNQAHGEILWDSNKKDTVIKKAVFAAPKTYALVFPDNSEIVKIKGFNVKNISYNELSENFYMNQDIRRNVKIIKKNNFKFKYEEMEKNLSLSFYDKRKFDSSKKKTSPITYEYPKI